MKPKLLLLVVPFVVAGLLQGCFGTFDVKNDRLSILAFDVPSRYQHMAEPKCTGYWAPITLGLLAVASTVGTILIFTVVAPSKSDATKECPLLSPEKKCDLDLFSPREETQIAGGLVGLLALFLAISTVATIPGAIYCSKRCKKYDAWFSSLSPEDLKNYKAEKKEALQRERCSSLQKTVEGLGTRYDLKRYYSECRKFINSFDFHGRTKLHLAVMEGSLKKTKLYLYIGAKINLWARDNYGWTPLHYAASIGSGDIVEILLKKGADPNIKDNEGKIPLDIAVEKGHEGVADILRRSEGR